MTSSVKTRPLGYFAGLDGLKVNMSGRVPSVSIASPFAGASVSGTVQVTAMASDNVAVIGVQMYLDGIAIGAETTTAPFSLSWDTTIVGNGSHTLTAVARDAAGNRTTSSAVQVTVSNNTSGLTVTITSPGSGSTVKGTVPVAATAWAAALGVRFYADGIQIGTEDISAPFTVSWDTATMSGECACSSSRCW